MVLAALAAPTAVAGVPAAGTAAAGHESAPGAGRAHPAAASGSGPAIDRRLGPGDRLEHRRAAGRHRDTALDRVVLRCTEVYRGACAADSRCLCCRLEVLARAGATGSADAHHVGGVARGKIIGRQVLPVRMVPGAAVPHLIL